MCVSGCFQRFVFSNCKSGIFFVYTRKLMIVNCKPFWTVLESANIIWIVRHALCVPKDEKNQYARGAQSVHILSKK